MNETLNVSIKSVTYLIMCKVFMHTEQEEEKRTVSVGERSKRLTKLEIIQI